MVMIKYDGIERPFYISNLLKQNYDKIINVCLEKNMSWVQVVDGRSGLGKTTLSMQNACYFAKKVAEWKNKHEPLKNGEEHKPNFTLDDVCFTPQQFIDRVKMAKKGDVIIMDEGMILSNRSAMSQYNRAVVFLMSAIRSKQIFIIFNINSIFDLDRNLAIFRADMLIHVYAEQDKFGDRGRYYVVPSAKGKLKNLYIQGKKYYSYVKARPAFNDKFSGWFPFDDKEYERRKQQSIEEFSNKEKPQSSIRLERTTKQRDRLILHLTKEYKYSQTELAKITHLSKDSLICLIYH